MFKFNRDTLRQLEATVDAAWAEVVAELDVEFIRVIESDSEFADLGFEAQDIVDTGRFRDSQVVTAAARRVLWRWAPTSPENGYCYAAALYYGFYAYGGAAWIEGRPWVARAIANIQPLLRLAEKLERKGLLVRVSQAPTNPLL